MSLSITATNTDADAPRWYVYLIENRLGHLYAGITLDPSRRISQHRGLRPGGAKALRGKSPMHFRAVFEVSDKSQALHAERRLKSLTRAQKYHLITSQQLCGATAVTKQFTDSSDAENAVNNQRNT